MRLNKRGIVVGIGVERSFTRRDITMNGILSRGVRLAFGAAVLATAGFGVRSAVAEPAPARETALSCPVGYNECICDGYTLCRRTACPICP